MPTKDPSAIPRNHHGPSRDQIEDWRPILEPLCKQKGATKTQIAGELGVSIWVFYQWEDKSPDFKEFMRELMTLSQCYWERVMALKATKGGPGSDSILKFIVSNNFRDHYFSERIQQEQKDEPMSIDRALEILKTPEVQSQLKTLGLIDAPLGK